MKKIVRRIVGGYGYDYGGLVSLLGETVMMSRHPSV